MFSLSISQFLSFFLIFLNHMFVSQSLRMLIIEKNPDLIKDTILNKFIWWLNIDVFLNLKSPYL